MSDKKQAEDISSENDEKQTPSVVFDMSFRNNNYHMFDLRQILPSNGYSRKRIGKNANLCGTGGAFLIYGGYEND